MTTLQNSAASTTAAMSDFISAPGSPSMKRRVVSSDTLEDDGCPKIDDNTVDDTTAFAVKKRKVTFGGTVVKIIPLPETEPDDDNDEITPNFHDGADSPLKFLQRIMSNNYGIRLEVRKSSDVADDFYHVPTEAQLVAYTMEVVSAARNNDLDELRRIHHGKSTNNDKDDSSLRLDAMSQFGESLLHLACRRGYEEMVAFLLTVPVPARVADDFGRNPVHDACWNPTPQLRICKSLVQKDPQLFLLADKRGFTPFDYARPQHWPVWKEFLWEHQQSFAELGQ